MDILAIWTICHQYRIWLAGILWSINVAPHQTLVAFQGYSYIFLIDVIKRCLIDFVEILDRIRHGVGLVANLEIFATQC